MLVWTLSAALSKAREELLPSGQILPHWACSDKFYQLLCLNMVWQYVLRLPNNWFPPGFLHYHTMQCLTLLKWIILERKSSFSERVTCKCQALWMPPAITSSWYVIIALTLVVPIIAIDKPTPFSIQPFIRISKSHHYRCQILTNDVILLTWNPKVEDICCKGLEREFVIRKLFFNFCSLLDSIRSTLGRLLLRWCIEGVLILWTTFADHLLNPRLTVRAILRGTKRTRLK